MDTLSIMGIYSQNPRMACVAGIKKCSVGFTTWERRRRKIESYCLSFGGLICGLNQLVFFSISIFRVCNDCQRLLIFLIITLFPALTPPNSCHMEHSSCQKNSSDDEKVTSVNDKLGNKENDNWKPTLLLTVTCEYGSLASPVVVGSKKEKLLRHVAMVAKFLDDNKPKSHLKSIRTISNFTDLIQIHLIWQTLAKFSFGPYLLLSKFRKRKQQF